MIRVQYRDDTFWTQVWHVCWYLLKRGQPKSFPMRGFVGRVSSLSAVTDPRPYRTSSIQMRRIHSTPGVLLWRLTYASEMCQPPLALQMNGLSSEESGRHLEVAGEEIFESPTSTISTFSVSPDGDAMN